MSGTALATDCPRTPGFWANHDWCDVPVAPDHPERGSVAGSIGLTCESDGSASGTFELAETGVSRTMEEWQEFLVSPTKGDKAVIMAQTFLATTLNFHRRPGTDPGCVDRSVDLSSDGLGTTTVRCVYRTARAWLNDSSFGDGKQTTWNPPTVELALGCTAADHDGTGSTTVGGEPLKDVLDAFNNATIGLDCDCGGAEDDDSDETDHRRNDRRGPGDSNGRGSGDNDGRGPGNNNGRGPEN